MLLDMAAFVITTLPHLWMKSVELIRASEVNVLFFFFSSSVSPFILLSMSAASMKRGEELRTCILLLLLRHTLQNCFCVSFFYSLFKHSGGCGEWPMEKPLNAQRHASEFACCCVMWFNYATKWHTEKHTDMSSAEIII